MKKWLLSIFTITTAMFLLVGCSNDSQTPTQEENAQQGSEEVQEAKIVVTVSQDEGEEIFSEKEIEIKENDILMDVMKENY